MKLSILFILSVSVLSISAGMVKSPPAAEDVKPQWTCPKLNIENTQASEAKADATKCEYLEFIRQSFIDQYRVPSYPACYAQMDTQCTDKISSFYEKKNIKIFSASLIAFCEAGAQWDDFATLLATFQTKFADAFTTDYWNCIKDKADEYVTAQYVPFPSWPAPHLDVLNYVCQGVESGLKNQDRIDFQAFFDDNGSFKTLENLGQQLWADVASKLGAASIEATLQTCLVEETGYFLKACIPEVEGAYNVKEAQGDDFEQAFLYVEENEELSGGATWNEDEEGYECWNYYSPTKHYHETQDKVSEDQFDGNRGHPGCGPNTMYQPLSFYGPICCPIHPIDFKPRTYNCCFESVDLSQVRSRNRPMRKRAACFGCGCLEGFEMDTLGDFWDSGDAYGACVKKVYEE